MAPNGSRQAGARFGKFAIKIGQSPNSDNDFPLLRYGEVLLNKLKPCSGRTATVMGQVWQRLIDQDRAGVPIYMGAITEGELLAERGRELFVEQLRRTD